MEESLEEIYKRYICERLKIEVSKENIWFDFRSDKLICEITIEGIDITIILNCNLFITEEIKIDVPIPPQSVKFRGNISDFDLLLTYASYLEGELSFYRKAMSKRDLMWLIKDAMVTFFSNRTLTKHKLFDKLPLYIAKKFITELSIPYTMLTEIALMLIFQKTIIDNIENIICIYVAECNS
ncbi:MAG: hypothetical protein K2K00_09000 [Muribaculaceae bacterium]|nr:hypothetical protein [Muribaculaceae bacterium]